MFELKPIVLSPNIQRNLLALGVVVIIAVFIISFISDRHDSDDDFLEDSMTLGTNSQTIPLKEAKLNIEHNSTDNDTGFQGAIDSEGWGRLNVVGPDGPVLELRGLGKLSKLGVTELFFETVEPANTEVPIKEMLVNFPEGNYTIEGPAMKNGESTGKTSGIAWLTHNIPAGPVLQLPIEGSAVPAMNLVVKWSPVTQTLTGSSVKIIAYQLIVEKDEPPHPHMIGKRGLSMYLPPSVTQITVPSGFLEPGTKYKWEVLAIEESGNQTLSSSEFSTQ